MTLYVNGALAASVPLAGTLRNGGPVPDRVLIGATRDGSNSSFQWKGLIDEVAIYNRALSADRVLAHYHAALPPPTLTLTPPNVLTWPAYFSDFQLQFTPTLGPSATWTTDTSARATNGGFLRVVVPTTEAQRFFRLIQP